MAPLDRPAEGPLPFWYVAGSGGQEVEPRSQASQDRVRSEKFRSAGRELDRQREPLEPHRDLGDGRRVVGRQLHARADGRGSLDEERHRLVAGEALEIRGADAGPAGPAAGTGNSCSPVMCNGTRLVARAVSRGAASRRRLTMEAAIGDLLQVVQDEQEVAVAEIAQPASPAAHDRAARAPSAPRRSRAGTRLGSVIGLRSARYTPSAKRPSWSAAIFRASRVLPMPPGPVSVSKRDCWRRAMAAISSCSRPTKELRSTGRLVRRTPAVRIGGNSSGRPSISSWWSCSGRSMSFRRWRPRSRRSTPRGRACSTSPRVASETRTCPPWPAAAIRAARWTSSPT